MAAAFQHKRFRILPGDQELIAKLKPRYQEILNFTGSDESLAVHINAPLGTAKSRRHRARNALQELRNQRARMMEGVNG